MITGSYPAQGESIVQYFPKYMSEDAVDLIDKLLDNNVFTNLTATHQNRE